jgi:hypothetical protein
MRGVADTCDSERCVAEGAGDAGDAEDAGDAGDAEDAGDVGVCVSSGTVTDTGNLTYVTSCSDTSGFVGDPAGRVVKRGVEGAESEEEFVELPQPCIICAFYFEEKKDHLLVVSVDGRQRFRCHCNIDFSQWILGLHCDSRRQQLYISQRHAVTVTDLSGRVHRVIGCDTISDRKCRFEGIDGNPDKLVVYDGLSRRLLLVSKETGELETAIGVGDFVGENRVFNTVCFSGSKILVCDTSNGRVHKVCSVSHKLITSYPNSRTASSKSEAPDEFSCPASVASLHNFGLMFVSDLRSHTVRILLSDGTHVQTLGQLNQPGDSDFMFEYPWGLCLVQDSAGNRKLVVADSSNHRLRVFTLL